MDNRRQAARFNTSRQSQNGVKRRCSKTPILKCLQPLRLMSNSASIGVIDANILDSVMQLKELSDLLVLCGVFGLSGCSSVLTEGSSAAAGVAGTALAAKVTNNAVMATGIGLGVQAAARAGVQYEQRKVHGEEQDFIANTAGDLAVGAVANWQIKHALPIEYNERGRVTVSRVISSQGMSCKEIVFSVDGLADQIDRPDSEFYVATICRSGTTWKWASAEPATERWGALQ